MLVLSLLIGYHQCHCVCHECALNFGPIQQTSQNRHGISEKLLS
jgi:hypothetical protein